MQREVLGVESLLQVSMYGSKQEERKSSVSGYLSIPRVFSISYSNDLHHHSSVGDEDDDDPVGGGDLWGNNPFADHFQIKDVAKGLFNNAKPGSKGGLPTEGISPEVLIA